VRRLTYRLGLTKHDDPEKIETEMQQILPPKDWTPFSMRLILHGRQICIARKPKCEICALFKDCPKIGVKTVSRKGSPSKSGSPSTRGRG
jgi:endonuclease-3